MEQQENDGFVSAADFFRQQPGPAAKPLPAADDQPRRLVRESLLLVARNSQVKNKISAFDKQQADGAALPSLTAARPAARRTGAAPALGAIAEEALAPPARRHAAVVSTAFVATAPRRHAAAVQTAPAAQPPAIAVPSPATKQQVAEKRHAAHFPSIMFQAPQPEVHARLPLAGGVAVLPPLPAAQPQVPTQPTPPQLRPLPGVLAPARASLSPRPQPAPQPQPQPALVPQAVAKLLAAEAAAVVAAESDDERDYVDAASGGPSQEGSAVFLDARDSHLVIQDDDAASVASDASTVVPDHHPAGKEQQLDGMGAEEAAAQPQLPAAAEQLEQWGGQAEQAAAPAELPEVQPAAGQAAAAAEHFAPVAVPAPRFSLGAAQLEPFQPEPAGLDAPFAAVPMRRSSLSPAPSAGQRRSSLGVAPLPQPPQQQEAESTSLRVSLSGGMAELAAAQQAAVEPQQEQQAHAAPPAVEQPSPFTAEPSAPAAAPTPESSAAGAPLQPEASRLSLSSSVSAAPSLKIEYSEARLRYSVELGLAHSPGSHRSNPSLERLPAVPASPAPSAAPEAELLPPAAAATPQQARLSLAAAASPVAPASTPASLTMLGQAAAARTDLEQRSQPVPASAVAQAIEAAATESSGAEEAGLIRRLSLAEPVSQPGQAAAEEQQQVMEQLIGEQPVRRTSFFSVPQMAEVAAAASPAAASASLAEQADEPSAPPPSAPAAEAVAASPTPPTPYAATEYDGDDVVMMDVDFTPCPTTGRRPRAGSSRFQLEALASAARPAAQAAMPPLPVPAAEVQAVQQQEQHAAAGEEPALQAEAAVAEPVQQASDETEQAEAGCGGSAAAAAAEHAAAPEEAAAQPTAVTEEGSRRTSLPALPEQDAASRRGRAGRLSLPAARLAAAAEPGSRASRLSLPGSMRFAAVSGEEAFAARPKLAMSPAASSGSMGRAAAPAQQDEEEVQQQQQQQQQQGQQQQADQQQQQGDASSEPVAAAEAAPAEQAAAPIVARSRLNAEDDELPAELVQPRVEPSPAATAPPETAGEAEQQADAQLAAEAVAAEPEQPIAEAQQLQTAEGAAPTHPAGQQQQVLQAEQPAADEESLAAAAAFAVKPKLAMSPALSAGAVPACGSFGAAADAADPFAVRPKLAMSPAVSSGSYGCIPAEQSDAALSSPAAAAAAAAVEPAAQEAVGGEAGSGSAERAWEMPAQTRHRDSPTMSDNPLALGGSSGDTPVAASPRRCLSHSPALSGLSAGAVSNNPMFAGTPSHPTPPSVNLKAFTSRLSTGTPQSGATAGSGGTPASTGIKLAEKLHQVAEQLQNPAAPQGLAVLATPGGARAATAAATPGLGRFEFADDVAGIMQALDARTPASGLAQPGGLSRVAAALATTVQRPGGGRAPRYSFAASGANQGLLDLEGYDANGDRSGQAGPTPLLRTQLLAATPATGAAAPSRLSLGGGPGSAAAATPAEVLALREEVAALRKQLGEANSQREEMVGLLGGYQRSIQELQDNHSVLVVRLQGDNKALKAEAEQLRRAHADTDAQFRALYNDKYLPLKEQAGELRREVATLQKRVVSDELKAHKAASDAAAVRQELAAAQERAEQATAAAAQAAAQAAAAREAEQRLQQQLAGEQRRSDKAAAAAHAELADLKAKYGGLTRQYDEAVHKINLAKQARERAQAEVQRKEEEVVALEVRNKEYADALKEYKRENSKFFEVKERYKGAIAALEKDLQDKERERQELLGLCNELMTRLEREGLSAA